MTTTDPYAAVSTRRTPQSKQADPRQVPNSAGGYTFALADADRVRRFLILGSDKPTYYASAAELIKDNAEVILRAARTDVRGLVRILIEVSEAGRAPKVNPTLLALAAAASVGDDPAEAARLDGELAEAERAAERDRTPAAGKLVRQLRHERSLVPAQARQVALDALPKIVRTGTHLFLFTRYVEQFRGWGPALSRAVAKWYNDKPLDRLAYQVTKYRQREGWAQADTLRLSHPNPRKAADETWEPRDALYAWATGYPAPVDTGDRHVRGRREISAKAVDTDLLPEIVRYHLAAVAGGKAEWLDAVANGASWEMLPDAALGEPEVWALMLDKGMPTGALLRQLPRLTRIGLLTNGSGAAKTVVKQLTDTEILRKARIHPVNVLVALRTYASGQGRGSSWTPVRRIIDALDETFYASFGLIEPTEKRTLLAVDCSASMDWSQNRLFGRPGQPGPLTAREGAAAMLMATAKVESDYTIVGFTSGRLGHGIVGFTTGRLGHGNSDSAVSELPISPRQRLDDVVHTMARQSHGGTDVALPMLWAQANRRVFDAIVIYTDNETWAGSVHPHQALADYRQAAGVNTKLIVVGMTSTGFSVADPSDSGSLDVVGFDSAAPQLISDFTRGL